MNTSLRSAQWLASSLKLAARCPVSGCWRSCNCLSVAWLSERSSYIRHRFRFTHFITRYIQHVQYQHKSPYFAITRLLSLSRSAPICLSFPDSRMRGSPGQWVCNGFGFLDGVVASCSLRYIITTDLLHFIIAALRSRCGHCIFALWFLSSIFYLFFIPRLISAVADWMSTILLYTVWP